MISWRSQDSALTKWSGGDTTVPLDCGGAGACPASPAATPPGQRQAQQSAVRRCSSMSCRSCLACRQSASAAASSAISCSHWACFCSSPYRSRVHPSRTSSMYRLNNWEQVEYSVVDPWHFGARIRASDPMDQDPTPAIFVLDLQDANKILFFSKFFCLLLFEGTFISIFSDKKS